MCNTAVHPSRSHKQYSRHKMPQKRSDEYYRLYGFTATSDLGRYTATCNFCGKELQNSAQTRMLKHRQICKQRRSQGFLDAPSNTTNMEKDKRNRHRIKIQKISGEDDDGCGTEGKEIIVKIEEIFDLADSGNENKTRSVLVRSETHKSANPGQEPEQHMEFEISGADFEDDSKEENLEDSTNGSPTLVEPSPRNNLLALKAAKMRAEIKQYQSKTQLFRTETDNLKVERTLTLLKIQKLRLEIDALRA